MTRIAVAFAFALVLKISVPATAQGMRLDVPSAAESDNNVDVIETFNVAQNGDYLLVPVTIGKGNFSFILDTGSRRSVFDASLREWLSPVKNQSINNKEQTELWDCKNVTFGKSRMRVSGPVLCTDLKQFRIMSGRDIRGVIGMDALHDRVIEIDFDRGTVTFMNRGDRSSVGMSIELDKLGRPTTMVQLADDTEVQFLVDTGCWGVDNGSLNRKVFDSLLENRVLVQVGSTKIASIYGTDVSRLGEVATISVDNYVHTEQLFHESASKNNKLGLGYLSRYKVTLDFPGRTMHLKKGRQFDRSFLLNAFEFSIGASGDGMYVTSVGRRPEMLGVHAEDRILEINGIDSRKMSMFEANLVLRNLERRPVALKLQPKNGTEVRYVTVPNRHAKLDE